FGLSIQHPPVPLFAQPPPPPEVFSAPLLKLCAASRIGLYPVHLHKFPSKASSTSCGVGSGLFRSNAYRDMTIPGVQNPHCEPCHFAILSWAGCGRFEEPIPSTVITCFPSILARGARQAFT